MIQAKGSGYAMSTEDELESIRQVALQTGRLGPLPGPALGRGGAAQCCTAQGGDGTPDRWAESPKLALQLGLPHVWQLARLV